MRNPIRTILSHFWQINPGMTLFWLANFLFLAIGIGGLFFDPRFKVLPNPTTAEQYIVEVEELVCASSALRDIKVEVRLQALLDQSEYVMLAATIPLNVQNIRTLPKALRVGSRELSVLQIPFLEETLERHSGEVDVVAIESIQQR